MIYLYRPTRIGLRESFFDCHGFITYDDFIHFLCKEENCKASNISCKRTDAVVDYHTGTECVAVSVNGCGVGHLYFWGYDDPLSQRGLHCIKI